MTFPNGEPHLRYESMLCLVLATGLSFLLVACTIAAPEKIARVARRESIGQRLRRLRIEHGLSQRDLSSPGVSYAYISRIEAGARAPSVKALRRLAGKLGVSVEQLETGTPTPIEQGIAETGLEYGSLTARELGAVTEAADEGARQAAHQAAKRVIEERREAEVARLRERLGELGA
jgi:transcriptional regulator with XRE-family HTH domain